MSIDRPNQPYFFSPEEFLTVQEMTHHVLGLIAQEQSKMEIIMGLTRLGMDSQTAFDFHDHVVEIRDGMIRKSGFERWVVGWAVIIGTALLAFAVEYWALPEVLYLALLAGTVIGLSAFITGILRVLLRPCGPGWFLLYLLLFVATTAGAVAATMFFFS